MWHSPENNYLVLFRDCWATRRHTQIHQCHMTETVADDDTIPPQLLATTIADTNNKLRTEHKTPKPQPQATTKALRGRRRRRTINRKRLTSSRRDDEEPPPPPPPKNASSLLPVGGDLFVGS